MWVTLFDRLLAGFFVEGTLRAVFPDGVERRYGNGDPTVTIRITDPKLPRRFVLNPELAMGEGYMDEGVTIDGDDLAGFFRLALLNRRKRHGTRWQRGMEAVQTALRGLGQINPAGRSKSNVAQHYDLSGKLYDLFLDSDRQYSCAYFETGKETLEAAQSAKKALIARKLLLSPGMRVLDIGCGWGGLALTLAREHGVEVLGITLSEEQHSVARQRVSEAGLSDQIDIRLMDYRDVRGRFDRIVSVGMFEHVGVPHYGRYFKTLHDRLSEDGIALVHTIGRSAPPQRTSAWIRKYIFPGGYVPSMSEITSAIERQDLWMADIEVLRLHYAETLRHWRLRTEENADAILRLYDERFLRMWRYYLHASEATFRHGWQAVFQIQLSRKVDAAPLTRAYLSSDHPASKGGTLAAQ